MRLGVSVTREPHPVLAEPGVEFVKPTEMTVVREDAAVELEGMAVLEADPALGRIANVCDEGWRLLLSGLAGSL